MSMWARRRAAVAAEEQAEALARAEAARQAEDQALSERSDEELLAEAGVKAPEDLLNGEEVRAFLEKELPERLKRRALRRLWRTNPVLANLDGLNDYDDDFTDAANPGGPVQTMYVVGKGILSQVKDLVEDAEDAQAEPEMAGVEDTPTEAHEPAPLAMVEPEPAVSDEPDPIMPSARRMRFTFERT